MMTNGNRLSLPGTIGHRSCWKRMVSIAALGLLIGFTGCAHVPMSTPPPRSPISDLPHCANTVTAEVVALEQVYYYNRFDAHNPAGLIYALRRDVIDEETNQLIGHADPNRDRELAGNVQLRESKRPRPLVLRVNEGDCLKVTFTNLIGHAPNGQEIRPEPSTGLPVVMDSEDPASRHVSMHVNGLNYVPTSSGIESDGANVGLNQSSLTAPGETKVYTWYAKKEGAYLFYSMGAAAGGEGDGGHLGLGLFGSVNVQPKGATWYRSQVTHEDLLAAIDRSKGNNGYTRFEQPILNYQARFPQDHPRAGEPILAMLHNGEIIYSDLNAVIDIQHESDCHHEGEGNSCGKPYREFTSIFHDELTAVQAFPELEGEDSPYEKVKDNMGINYGAAALGPMVLASRKHIGPAANCPECKLEEFFLTSWANGDPAMVVEKDAQNRAVKVLYPDDPSNVHHSYMGDPVRFRNMHAGPKETHVFHLHAHQWVQDKHDPNALYLDSQTISPGAVFSYEIHYGGSGNRNFTPGDSIFHCHLYPHFAEGMWELWRSHDVFEDGMTGGTFDPKKPIGQNNDPRWRNLPDAEITGGTPNPAIVPLPRTPLPPMPIVVEKIKDGKKMIDESKSFLGYPFYIAGIAGHRPPQPPLDLDHAPDPDALQRHIIIEGTVKENPTGPEEMRMDPANPNCNKPRDPDEDLYDKGKRDAACIAGHVHRENGDPYLLSFAQELNTAHIKRLPHDGTVTEKRAIAFHAGLKGTQGEPGHNVTTRYNWEAKGYPSCDSSGRCDDSSIQDQNDRVLFHVNGREAKPGAPFADPCPNQFMNAQGRLVDVQTRRYRAAYLQFDMQVNKHGWHDPQARIAVLEEDLKETLTGERPTEPLFFRVKSGECVEFKATNLVPSNLNLDDFQFYSPTDVIGQHIHLVKFDVTSSDGSGNGWNYEDGTLAADEIRERIAANNTYQMAHGGTQILKPKTHRIFKSGGELENDPRGQCPDSLDPKDWNKHPWCGAQTTVQRWWADPLLNKPPGEVGGWDRTMRTVFTHDHFGPSSHQHHGLYAGLVIEPTNSKWEFPNGDPMGGDGANHEPKKVEYHGKVRGDGGPTHYAANIITRNVGSACLENESEKKKKEEDKKKGETAKDSNLCPDEDNPVNVDEDLTKREFNLAFADFAIVYDRHNQPVNPPNRTEATLFDPFVHHAKPFPESISASDPGTQLLNYRNEPIPLRVGELNAHGFLQQKPGAAGNLANVFSSRTHKYQGTFGQDIFTESLSEGRHEGDPATPLLRAYDGDHVQIRLIQGAQEENHVFTMHGTKWLSQPGSKNSGYSNGQQIGISEHFEMDAHVLDDPDNDDSNGTSDYFYASSAADNLWDGQWGLLRAFDLPNPKRKKHDKQITKDIRLKPLPVNERLTNDKLRKRRLSTKEASLENKDLSPEDNDLFPGERESAEFCPKTAPRQNFSVSAWLVRDILPQGVAYNERFGIKDPYAIIFLEDPKKDGKRITGRESQIEALRESFGKGKRIEPLVLRAAAGDCIKVVLRNRLPLDMPDGPNEPNSWTYNTLPPITEHFNFNQVQGSNRVGLHTQLVAHRAFDGGGENVGLNKDSTAFPCQTDSCNADAKKYTWYAGQLNFVDPAEDTHIPIEFGVVSLTDMADVIKHPAHGAIGALVIEPENSQWGKSCGENGTDELKKSEAMKDVCNREGKVVFRDFVLLYQDYLALQQAGQPMANLRNGDDAEDSGQKAFNYSNEPLWARLGLSPADDPETTSEYDWKDVFSSRVRNAGCPMPPCDPATPIFTAEAGSPVRFRVVHPAGHPRNHAFTLFGHDWVMNPWGEDDKGYGSAVMTDSNHDSVNRIGSAGGIGPARHVNILTTAGGCFKTPGDYLYRTQEGFQLGGGLWGIFRVTPEKTPHPLPASCVVK